MMYGNGGWFMGGMWIWWLVIIAVFILLIWFVVTSAGRRARDQKESPERVLKRRYANGEIDRQTYLHMRDDLRK